MYLKMLLLVLIYLHLQQAHCCSANDVSEKLETGKTILNAIHSDEVKKIMQNLNNLIYEREYQSLNSRN